MSHPEFDVGNKPFGQESYPEGFGPEPPPTARRHGCFFYGCIIALILGVLGLIMVGVLAFTVYRVASGLINDYTSTTPVALPKVSMPPEEREALDKRWAAFKASLDKDEAAELVLTADEVNALISENPQVKDRAYVRIDDDKVSAQVSIPLDELGIPMTRGRFLNGKATVKVQLRDGDLDVRLQDLEVNGKVMPPEAKAQLAGENLAKNVNNDPRTAEYFRKIDSLVVKDGKVILKAKSKADREAADDAHGDDRPAETSKDPDKAERDRQKAKEKARDDPPKSDEAAPKPAEGTEPKAA